MHGSVDQYIVVLRESSNNEARTRFYRARGSIEISTGTVVRFYPAESPARWNPRPRISVITSDGTCAACIAEKYRSAVDAPYSVED